MDVKIIILGSTGMLGNAVGKAFINQYGENNVFLSFRKSSWHRKNSFFYDPLVDDFTELKKIKCDYIINCIGIIKPFVNGNEINTIKLNSIFPWRLADYCESQKIKMIHITTDCVFSGKTGNYNELSEHDCTDLYGYSKSAGEPNNFMVLRTSIIGEEIRNKVSLIEWAKSQKGKKVKGFVNHQWNGMTTNQYARVCIKIINQNLYEKGIFHIHSNSVSKFELLHLISDNFKLDLDIYEFSTPDPINRIINSCKRLNNKLCIPSINYQFLAG